MMLSRRSFFKLTGASTIGWYAATRFGWVQRALAQIPGGTLDPTTVPKYQTPLLIPPVMPRAATITMPGGKPADYYEISMKQFKEQILPSGFPGTTVWGYGAVKGRDKNALLIHKRSLPHDRGAVEATGPYQVDQRPEGRERRVPAAPASRRPDVALGQPAWRRDGPRYATDVR